MPSTGRDDDKSWLTEAVVDFLRGPLYIHPVMQFMDDKCQIFTPEEENKLEYTSIHNEFKAIVDELLTDFLKDIGSKPEDFFEIVSSRLTHDKFTDFVVHTILTVDDFPLFKAMMVKRNIDLTNQVFEALDELHNSPGTVAAPSTARPKTPQEDHDFQAALQVSQKQYESEAWRQNLERLMRSLQLQDEDIALGIATSESIKENAVYQMELAELEQAIAMSLALQGNHHHLTEPQAAALKQVAKAGAPAAAAGPNKPAAPGGPSGSQLDKLELPRPIPARPVSTRGFRPFPEPRPVEMGPMPTFTTDSATKPAQPSTFKPMGKFDAGPNEGAKALNAVAAAAAKAANSVEEQQSKKPAPSKAGPGDGAASESKLPALAPPRVPPKMEAPLNRFVPAPLSEPIKPQFDASGPSAPPAPVEDASQQFGRFASTAGQGRDRAVGYRSSGTDKSQASSGPASLAAIREAAAEAAITQKKMMNQLKSSDESPGAQSWLQDAKLKLVAQKKMEREAEMAAYTAGKARQAGSGARGLTTSSSQKDNMEEKRAELRNKLAEKFKQDLLNGQ